MRVILFILKLGLKILAAPVVLALMLFTWLCFGLLYVSSFIFGLASTVVALLGIAVLVTSSPQNGVILLVIAFLVSPLGLPMAAAWLVGKVQDLRYAIQDALKAYARRKDKDLRTLVRYAKLFRVEKILRQYLEVLL